MCLSFWCIHFSSLASAFSARPGIPSDARAQQLSPNEDDKKASEVDCYYFNNAFAILNKEER
ncbi:unnamed protein product [Larinioides sclopetarius]|uniref:Secreted protein n=1 Tax=Larinioides sclopetarius TaxID=280406 RepID=A0AAV1ZGJ5_9ARAC